MLSAVAAVNPRYVNKKVYEIRPARFCRRETLARAQQTGAAMGSPRMRRLLLRERAHSRPRAEVALHSALSHSSRRLVVAIPFKL